MAFPRGLLWPLSRLYDYIYLVGTSKFSSKDARYLQDSAAYHSVGGVSTAWGLAACNPETAREGQALLDSFEFRSMVVADSGGRGDKWMPSPWVWTQLGFLCHTHG